MVDLRHLPPDENPERRLDNIEEEETRGQRSSESRPVDLKQKSLQALAQSLESRGVSALPPGPSLDEGKHGGAFAKPKEALLLALSDLQCNDWEVNLYSSLLLVSNPTHSHDYTLTGRGGGFGGCGETCNMAPWPPSAQVGFWMN